MEHLILLTIYRWYGGPKNPERGGGNVFAKVKHELKLWQLILDHNK
jgi:hypothetical protein